MSDPYIGEIRMFAGNFAPAGWAFCDGRLLAIAENDALFTLIGTTYGGDGQSTFALPDLRGRVPVHMGQGPGISQSYQIGEAAGVESVTVTMQQTPVHNHAFVASTASGAANAPQGNVVATPAVAKLYRLTSPSDPLAANMIGGSGGSQPHDNRMPFIAINYIISLFGIFPSPT
jgi:microcystin-dependent protein